MVSYLKPYSIADLLNALGGISNSLKILGMLCAHFVAKMYFKKALIEDLFLW